MWFVPVITAVGDGIQWDINVDEAALAAMPVQQKQNGRIPHEDEHESVGDNMV